MSISAHDREVLRGLAGRVAEIAALPVQAERKRLWTDLNGLRSQRPMVLAFPQSAWRELVPEESLRCEDALARSWELTLRKKVYQHEQIRDDFPIDGFFNVRWVVRLGDYGLETRFEGKDSLAAGTGSYRWDPPVKRDEDLDKLHVRSIEIDRPETDRQLELAHAAFGDLLPARAHGRLWFSVGLTQSLIELRGLEQAMLDMYERPAFLHRLMALLRDDMANVLETLEREGVLTLNSQPMDTDDFLGSGGVGYTDELPAAGFEGHVRLQDMWGLGESQEFAGVGPGLFHEFALQYQLPLLNRFGLACYGCCEPLDGKLDLLLRHIPRLRRVSISAWGDRAVAAEKLGGRSIFSWKPAPSLLSGPRVDWAEVERVTRETIAIARGCPLEIIMKTTETFCHEPGRLTRWSEITSALAGA
jgi:hypothetical protein